MLPLFKTHPQFAADETIKHGFFSRLGGMSSGVFAELNCGPGSGDDLQAIHTNRTRVVEALGFSPTKTSLHTLAQIHSNQVHIVDKEWPNETPQEGDALVTDNPETLLGILTADCAPVLFADTKHCVIGAAHAGWKGALAGVLENTIDAMIRCGAKREHIQTVIGPCIHQTSYEMGPEILDQFLTISNDYHVFFKHAPKQNHFMFDLPGFVRYRLDDCGVESIVDINIDTYANPDYFSYRRNTHQGLKQYGRLVSVIGIIR